MSTDVVVKEVSDVAIAENSWGTGGTDSRDILLPKLLFMQGLSTFVADGKAAMGDIVDSVTGEVLGNMREQGRKPVEFIPIMTFKTWVEQVVTELKPGQITKKFKAVVPMTAENADLPFESIVNGEKIQRDRTINFYAVLSSKLEDFPYLLSFRRTSFRAGQKLSTHFQKCEMAAARGKPVPPAATTFSLVGNKVTNDKGTFYVADLEPVGPTSSESLRVAYEWFQVLNKSAIRVDHSDLTSETDAENEDIEAVATNRF